MLDDFVEGFMRMKGQASAIDMHALKYQIKGLKASQERLFRSINGEPPSPRKGKP